MKEIQLKELLEREELIKNILAELNQFVDLRSSLTAVLRHIHELTHCESTGIRLQDNGDYPYFVYYGFPESFILHENSLCAKDARGKKIKSPDGNGYLLECMCGNIISGKFDPQLEFFTKKGAFWSNHTTQLLTSTTTEERQGKTRNYCNAQGYESVALIPVKSRDERIGLLQLNDRRTDMFTEELISFLEMVAEQIGVAVQNSMLYSQLKKLEHEHRKTNEQLYQQNIDLQQTINDLKETQNLLIEAKKMASLGNLVSGISHEINTPVGICITASSTLIQETKGIATLFTNEKMSKNDLKSYMESVFNTSKLILSNMERAGTLIQSFKQTSIDQTSERKRTFFVKKMIDDLFYSITPALKEIKLSIHINCDDTLCIHHYPGAFSQILTNLVFNSKLHGFCGKDSGTIDISVTTNASGMVITYKDDGHGIEKAILSKIFDPFYTTNKQSGSGLGLHIVYNIVSQLLKGKIECTSQKGKGTTFRLTLPIEQSIKDQ
ncbi:MAG: HAMP domain-containing histidine kinase [Candidatus Magnetomorum sp.]|nr:HAMP domain-containing histidine kinase [Candidatus Magnetomorum sp.]